MANEKTVVKEAPDNLTLQELAKISKKLEKVIFNKLDKPGAPEPPRLVRANSAFGLYSALETIKKNPEFAAFLKQVNK